MQVRCRGKADYRFIDDTHLEANLDLILSVGPIAQNFQARVSSLLDKDELLFEAHVSANGKVYIEYIDVSGGKQNLANMLPTLKQYGAHRLTLAVVILQIFGAVSYKNDIFSDASLEFDETVDCSQAEQDALILACSLV